MRERNSTVGRERQKESYEKQEGDKGKKIVRGADRDMNSGTQKETVGRRQLSELDQNRMIRGELVREAKRQAEPGKWKRIARPELGKVVMEADTDKENNTSLGMKRNLQMIVWEEDFNRAVR